jgi:hypothetical protein
MAKVQVRACLDFAFGSEKWHFGVLPKAFLRYIAQLRTEKKAKGGSQKDVLQPEG